MSELLPIIGTILGGGGVTALVTVLVIHGKKHQHVDDRLCNAESSITSVESHNAREHGAILGKLDAIQVAVHNNTIEIAKVAKDVTWIRNGRPTQEGTT